MKRLIQDLWSYCSFTLILIGLWGLSWRTFGAHGWLMHWLNIGADDHVESPILATPILLGTVLLALLFMRGGLKTGKSSWLDDTLIYGMMLVGLYFAAQWLNGPAV